MDMIDVKSQSLGPLICQHNICQNCHIVDNDGKRSRVGYACPVCKAPSEGGRMFFNLSVHTLINLMQEAFHADAESLTNSGQEEVQAHDVSVVLFFCTLREVLLINLIEKLCSAQSISQPIYERLMADNRSHIQRQDQLLPTLIGVKWKTAVEEINKKHSLDYIYLNQFIVEVVKKRNKVTIQHKKT